jgi:hypothetical protein
MGNMAGWTPDRWKLYNQGRCKYMWVAWSNDEQKEIQASKTPQEVINRLREGYIDANKAAIIDPTAAIRQNKVEWNAAAEEYEIVYGKKPHHFATIATIRKKIAEKETNKPLEEPKAKKAAEK